TGMNHLIKDGFAKILAFVWDDDLRRLAGPRRVVVFVLRVTHMLFKELLGGQLNLRAMSLVYTTLLSIVPLLAVSFSVLKGFGYHERLESYLFDIMFEPLGPSGNEVAETIIGFVANVKVGMLGSLGFALLIYTVVALVQKIEAAFNFVWQIDRLRSMSQRFSNYLSVITIGPVLVFSAVGIGATMLNTDIARKLVSVEPFGTLMLYAGNLAPYVLISLAFTFVYILIPNTRVEFRAALIGGVIAGVLWKITGWGFATFIVSSAKYAAIYSSFAILILLLIWMYLSWLILLVGSQIAYFVQNPRFMTLHRVEFVLSNRLREQLALQIMYLVGYNHLHRRDPWQLDQLIKFLDLPDEPVSRMIKLLVRTNYLMEIDAESGTTYLPVYDIDTLRLADILSAVRRGGESRFLSVSQLKPVKAVDDLMAETCAATEGALGERTLKDLILSADGEPGVADTLPIVRG
ncbi:MAG: YihY/virulence factor BrkB family protein, partial [Halobacteria archaeon]|nr:YihY/virulence factor BrkB family protein [Halobacteria archaeon]